MTAESAPLPMTAMKISTSGPPFIPFLIYKKPIKYFQFSQIRLITADGGIRRRNQPSTRILSDDNRLIVCVLFLRNAFTVYVDQRVCAQRFHSPAHGGELRFGFTGCQI